MKLKPDKLLRDRWFVPGAMSHPAKGHLGLWWELFERYTKPGQWVLDPMAGIGSSMIGAMMGRNVICNEMETHFIMPMRASWAKMRQQVMLGATLGQVVIIQGDARCLPLGRADVVVTSPPYEQSVSALNHGGDVRPQGGFNGGWEAIQRIHRGYTRPIAAVVTSPPFGEAERRDQSPYQDGAVADMMSRSYRSATHPGAENIGNLRGNAYWEAMRLVYAECHRVLAPGGVMVLVVKGYTRDGKYVDLPQQTVDECEKLGFKLRERWERELWNLSFWRILQQRRDPAAFDERLRYEDVLVLEKE